jgi:predicted house-cleaning NTP pyrophosphatase (Maf/HAM1 superfamily)
MGHLDAVQDLRNREVHVVHRLEGRVVQRVERDGHPLETRVFERLRLDGEHRSVGGERVRDEAAQAIGPAEPGEKIRFAGQEIAALAAETSEAAEDAIRAIRVSYAPRPFVVSLEKAMESAAPLVFDGKAETKTSAGEVEESGKGLPRNGNVLGPRAFSRGDVAKGFAQADVIVEGTYETQVQTHTALETHGLVARWEGDQLTVWASTQGIFSVREELAQAMEIPASKVRVITEYMGGGFGAKFGARIEGVAAARLLARKKAESVAATLPGRLVLGADQTLARGTVRFSKPADRAEAAEQLRKLRGCTHELHSGLALVRDGKLLFDCADTARLTMRDFSDQFLEEYLDMAGRAALASVGGYQLEGVGVHLFERVEGDYFTILGLPLLPLLAFLREKGFVAG